MRKFPPLKRTAGVRAPKRKFIIFTEGKNTEPEYFKALKSYLMGALIEIEIIDAAGVPKTIAEKASDRAKKIGAKKQLSSFEEGDEIWAVFDKDEHPNIAEAFQKCDAAKVGVAFSNPCFELWLILQFEDFDKPDHRHDVQKHLGSLCTDYDRKARKSTDCAKIIDRVEDAERRAERQLARRIEEGEPPPEPFTTVFNLTRKMREAEKAYKG